MYESYREKGNIMSDTNVNDIVNQIDQMMSGGVSRLKVKMSEDIPEGEMKKEYHHGRCDINSPWACGAAFDVLEPEED